MHDLNLTATANEQPLSHTITFPPGLGIALFREIVRKIIHCDMDAFYAFGRAARQSSTTRKAFSRRMERQPLPLNFVSTIKGGISFVDAAKCPSTN